MGILDTLKDAVTLIQKADNIELNRTILGLQSQVFDLVEENRRLKDKDHDRRSTHVSKELLLARGRQRRPVLLAMLGR